MQIPNIVDRLDPAHLTWKAYMEGCPGQCGGGPTGCANIDSFNGATHYGPNHNPFIYYTDIQNNSTRCAHIVSANSAPVSQNICAPTPVVNDDLFIKDLNSVSNASNYMFLTPNKIDDIHDCNDVTVGNDWLNQLVPQVLNSTLFRTKRAALFITFDEAGCTNPNDGQKVCPGQTAAPDLYTIWASNSTNTLSKTKVGFKSSLDYTHFSALRTIEINWGLLPLVASADGSASDMHEFFGT
jgi:acid phosphatase